jgi:hypothetical protein
MLLVLDAEADGYLYIMFAVCTVFFVESFMAHCVEDNISTCVLPVVWQSQRAGYSGYASN